MAPNTPPDLFNINEKAGPAQKLTLTAEFDKLAAQKWLDQKATEWVKQELLKKWNGRLDTGVKSSIAMRLIAEDIPNQLDRAKQDLASASKALAGVRIEQSQTIAQTPSQSVASNLPPNNQNALHDVMGRTVAWQNFKKAFDPMRWQNI